jgi:hypothetical protein
LLLIAGCTPGAGPAATTPTAETPCERAWQAAEAAEGNTYVPSVFQACSTVEYVAASAKLANELPVLDAARYRKICDGPEGLRETKLCTTLTEELDIP